MRLYNTRLFRPNSWSTPTRPFIFLPLRLPPVLPYHVKFLEVSRAISGFLATEYMSACRCVHGMDQPGKKLRAIRISGLQYVSL